MAATIYAINTNPAIAAELEFLTGKTVSIKTDGKIIFLGKPTEVAARANNGQVADLKVFDIQQGETKC